MNDVLNFVFQMAWNGDVFARMNKDGVWSVRWDNKAETVSKSVLWCVETSPQSSNAAIVGMAKALVAARNHITLKTAEIPVYRRLTVDIDTAVNAISLAIKGEGKNVAQVSKHGYWYIDWDRLTDISKQDGKTAKICTMLVGAKEKLEIRGKPIDFNK
jgi:hypothetical protein